MSKLYAQKNFCPKCNHGSFKKDGKRVLQIFTKRGRENKSFQRFSCNFCSHVRHNVSDYMIGRFDNKMINWIGFIYLRSFSLHATVDIVRSFYEKDYITKDSVLAHLEQLVDLLPSVSETTKIFKPLRSGYYAFDGMWFKFQGDKKQYIQY